MSEKDSIVKPDMLQGLNRLEELKKAKGQELPGALKGLKEYKAKIASAEVKPDKAENALGMLAAMKKGKEENKVGSEVLRSGKISEPILPSNEESEVLDKITDGKLQPEGKLKEYLDQEKEANKENPTNPLITPEKEAVLFRGIKVEDNVEERMPVKEEKDETIGKTEEKIELEPGEKMLESFGDEMMTHGKRFSVVFNEEAKKKLVEYGATEENVRDICMNWAPVDRVVVTRKSQYIRIYHVGANGKRLIREKTQLLSMEEVDELLRGDAENRASTKPEQEKKEEPGRTRLFTDKEAVAFSKELDRTGEELNKIKEELDKPEGELNLDEKKEEFSEDEMFFIERVYLPGAKEHIKTVNEHYVIENDYLPEELQDSRGKEMNRYWRKLKRKMQEEKDVPAENIDKIIEFIKQKI
jgi:hypothetical protein